MKKRATYKGLLIVLGITLTGGIALADGNTIAASAKKQTLAFQASRTLLSGLNGEDVCTTIINRSDKTGLIQLTLTDDNAAASISVIPKRKSQALCVINTESVEVECLGPKKCAFIWSVDKF